MHSIFAIVIYMLRNMRMRSAAGGWVLNNSVRSELTLEPFLKGLDINMWAVEVVAVCKTLGSADIFSSALARPSGYLVRRAPLASAKYSLLLETAS